jgi:LmbE family N-acetylglucosaminyl deacetylase
MVTNNMSGQLQPDDTHSEPYFLPPTETQAIRHREQSAAAALIGAKLHFLNYPQRHYWDGKARAMLTFAPREHDPLPANSDKPPLLLASQNIVEIEKMGQLLVSLKPAAIVTQTITDVDPEHHATASLVWQGYRSQAQALRGVPLLFWAPGTSSFGGMLPAQYDHFVCLTQSQFDMKMKMLNAHASQMTQRRLDMAAHRARYWGWEMGKQYAEVFTTVFNGLERHDS